MLRLRSLNVTPPGYFRYQIPELSTKPEGWIKEVAAYADLEDEIRKRYQANKIPVPANLSALIQDQLCRSLPAGHCVDENNLPWQLGGFAMTVDQIKQGTLTLLDWFVRYGGRKADRGEIATRSNICRTCPNNQQPLGCTTCASNELRNVADRIVGGEQLPEDNGLEACAICGCSLKAKVRLPLEVLLAHTSKEQLERFPEWCWMVKR